MQQVMYGERQAIVNPDATPASDIVEVCVGRTLSVYPHIVSNGLGR